MSVLIGHARQDENGTIDGVIAGDQTGKEICTQNWYKRTGGWGVYLRPLDSDLANRAASFVEQICKDDNFGYSQPNRWDGYKSIIANGNSIQGAKGDFDCSSLCFAAYLYSGLNVGMGYTGNLEKYFLNTGMFKAQREPEYLESGAMSQRGGMYLMAGKHVMMVLENTDEAMPDGEESPNEAMPDGEESPNDIPVSDGTIARPYVQVYGSVRIRLGPATTFAKLYTSKDERLPYLMTDSSTGWHKVQTGKGIGYVSGKPNLTRVFR